MALTGYTDDCSSDDGNAERSKIEPREKRECVEQEGSSAGVEYSGLNTSNLEEHNKNMGEEIQECPSETKTEVGAGVLFGLSGLFLGGPILALLAGVGATIVASKDEGPVGDVARATGEFAVTTGSKVGEAAKEANEKHGILDKIKNAFTSGWSKVQQYDEEHKIGEKTKETMSDAKQKTVEFEQKHHVMENILEGIQNGVNFLLEKLRDTTSGESCATGEHCKGSSSS
mmetsp:Transcript_10613/g.23457  ORF Transcript_10613/g.23457 Transcript_10613/m.23457 type:complete len:229 (+) Transcript_10613:150-836(+)|eukprot:CAMPEP_0172321978 /NCGR_PEP_ID=MMETSP1058-20130122/44734_1 /TAXON_ID=83371 /ORGANISM="Detonula confervacea, Strain CCMP 353" /LENGTH=228 /DNA_ID=CAMNT_0013037605 /DNA_START=54 /DNA_END=740 /DNA_ORIENTATION=-